MIKNLFIQVSFLIIALIIPDALTIICLADIDQASSNVSKNLDALLQTENQTPNPANDNSQISICQALTLQSFIGKWSISSQQASPLFDIFKETQGKILLNFNEGYALKNRLVWYEEPASVSNITQIQMIIIDGEYHDENLYLVTFEDLSCDNFNISTGIFSLNQTNALMGPLQDCDINMRIDLKNAIENNNGVYSMNDNMDISLEMSSSNCSLNLTASLHRDTYNYRMKMLSEILFQGSILLVSFFTNMKLIRSLFRFTTESNKLSLIVPVFLAIWDLIFLINMNVFADLKTFEIVLILFCIESALFMFSSILLLSVPMMRKTQNMSLDITASQFLRTSCQYGLPPVAAMVLFITLSEEAFFHPVFLFFINLYLVPQIIHNIIKGAPVTFEPKTLALIISLRPLFPLYLKGCPSNLYQISPSTAFVLCLVIAFIAQVLTLYLQAKYGVRFFIPRKVFPMDYNYFHDISEDNQGTELVKVRTCNICMENLSKHPNFGEISNSEVTTVLNRLKVRPEKVTKTECKHKFHAACLIDWMMVKMECPVCKAPLKAIE